MYSIGISEHGANNKIEKLKKAFRNRVFIALVVYFTVIMPAANSMLGNESWRIYGIALHTIGVLVILGTCVASRNK